MITYVGLDLGVDTSRVTNSFTSNGRLRKHVEGNMEVDAEQGGDVESVRQVSIVLDIRPDVEGWNR
jgi:hypothetical protein